MDLPALKKHTIALYNNQTWAEKVEQMSYNQMYAVYRSITERRAKKKEVRHANNL